jgi:PBSX family phage terminase large subunit
MDTVSEKQNMIMEFPYMGYDALICDGAVRSGKTSIMTVSFFMWAMNNFSNCAFAFCGKSVGAVERNIIQPFLGIRKKRFFAQYNRGEHVLIGRKGRRENRFYLFGGRDESSYTLIQGITLAGVMLDEVALMPRSFVEQALARCSVRGAKLWFNCNPENPQHWFRQEWILQPEKHKALHLHFLMDDNPGLDEETKERYRSMYSGVFYERYVLGRWVMSEGLIYDMFDPTANTYREDIPSLPYACQRYIACDYGTTNPCVFLDIYDDGEHIRVDREYRWDSRKERRQKTDQEYADDFLVFMGDVPATVLVDPSAASFIVALRQRGVYVREANNDVLDGIRKTGVLLNRREILIHERCSGLIDEMGTYLWDDKAAKRGEEKPVKQNDHSADALRYFVNNLPDWRLEGVQTQ